MKKRYLLLIVALLVMATLCACGNSGKEKDPNENKIVITAEFLEEELADEITATIDAQIISKMNGFASKRKGTSAGWEDGAKFTDYETTSVELVDDYTVRVYGKLYGTTDYGDSATGKFSIKVWCEKDAESEQGYTMRIEWGLDSQLTIK